VIDQRESDHQAEVLALRNGAIRILHAKGGRSRTVGMDALGFEILDRWLQARSSLPVGEADALFCLVNGKPMQSCYVRVFLPRIAKKAGILRRVHAHGFRHTHAAELRGEGVDIGVISKQLGHRSIATTARYLDHIAPWDVVNAMRNRQWMPQAIS
jgi:site-specific recombinase XerD